MDDVGKAMNSVRAVVWAHIMNVYIHDVIYSKPKSDSQIAFVHVNYPFDNPSVGTLDRNAIRGSLAGMNPLWVE